MREGPEGGPGHCQTKKKVIHRTIQGQQNYPFTRSGQVRTRRWKLERDHVTLEYEEKDLSEKEHSQNSGKNPRKGYKKL